MSHEIPSLILDFGGSEYEATPDNTTLFTFLGRTALNGIDFDNSRANHIFFENERTEGDVVRGSYMFRTEHNSEAFDTIMRHIAMFGYPMELNKRTVPQCDLDAYNRMLDKAAATEHADDYIPDDWLNGGTDEEQT